MGHGAAATPCSRRPQGGKSLSRAEHPVQTHPYPHTTPHGREAPNLSQHYNNSSMHCRVWPTCVCSRDWTPPYGGSAYSHTYRRRHNQPQVRDCAGHSRQTTQHRYNNACLHCPLAASDLTPPPNFCNAHTPATQGHSRTNVTCNRLRNHIAVHSTRANKVSSKGTDLCMQGDYGDNATKHTRTNPTTHPPPMQHIKLAQSGLNECNMQLSDNYWTALHTRALSDNYWTF